MFDAGLTIFEVQQRLGHRSPTMTAEVYTHLMRERYEEGREKMEDYMKAKRFRAEQDRRQSNSSLKSCGERTSTSDSAMPRRSRLLPERSRESHWCRGRWRSTAGSDGHPRSRHGLFIVAGEFELPARGPRLYLRIHRNVVPQVNAMITSLVCAGEPGLFGPP